MSDGTTKLNYASPDLAGSMRAKRMRKFESAFTIGSAALLLIVIPGLYKASAIDINTVNQLGRFLCFAITALGIDLIWGYCGILSLCQAMFFCFGGYAIGMHMALHSQVNSDGVPQVLSIVSSAVSGFKLPSFWIPFRPLASALFLALFIPGLVAFIFGYFAFRSRVRGVYFSIITQATVFACCLVFRRNETLLCGTNGLTAFKTMAGFDLTSASVQLGFYLITVLALIFAFIACQYLVKSRLGRLMVAVRDNESRLRFAGYQPVTIKAFAFTLAAVLAGIGGLLYTPQKGIITPATMEPIVSVGMVLWVAVGGRGTLTGAVVGAVLVNYAENFLTSSMPRTWPLVQGGIFISVVLLFPDGVVGVWKNFSQGDKGAAAPRDQEATETSVASSNTANMLGEGARQ